MKLIKINSQNYVNPEHVVTVAFLQEKLKTIVICVDKMIVESDFSFDETADKLVGILRLGDLCRESQK